MSEHKAAIAWFRNTESFAYEDYDRRHSWKFDGGVEVSASAAPEFLGDAACVDPEQAFVASVASCHMLTFLAIASKKRLVVDNYADEAIGVLEKNEDGRLAITRVTLRPRVTFGDDTQPTSEQIYRMHESAHRGCFIANSVRSEITIETD